MAAEVSAEPGAAAPETRADFFELNRHKVTVWSEVLAGVSTFLTMSYIAFVNPGILTSVADRNNLTLDFGATVTATCWVASLMCILMGIIARRPFCMAPGMGLNAVVTFQLVAAGGLTWSQAFGIVVLEGIIITALVLTGFRSAIMDAVPMDLKKAIAAGIGLFLLYIGLINGGLVAGNPLLATDPTAPPVQLGQVATWPVLVTVIGIIVTVILYIRKFRGAILVGIAAATIIATILNYAFNIYDPRFGWAVIPSAVVQVPTMPTFFGMDLGAFGSAPVSASLSTFAIMLADFFDTMGTLVGLGLLAGFLDEQGKMARTREALFVDSLGPIAGGALGASSATTYIESGAGISAGGRTGLVAITVGALFLVVPFLTPIIAIVPPQATAAALIVVGALMFASLKDIDWNFANLFPVLVTTISMPLTYSITNGIGFGFIAFTVVALATGKKVHPLMWVVSLAFVVYFVQALIRMWIGVA
jgi:AGZA family xanthine/uracil permease-like MFS transporter